MATVSIDDLANPITVEEWKASFYNGLATVGVSTTTWKPGAVTRTLVAIVCVCLYALSKLVSALAASAFVGSAAGLWLRLHARHTYAIETIDETFAAGKVAITNSTATAYPVSADSLVFEVSSTRKRYRNTAATTIPANAAAFLVDVEACEAGAASSALVGELDTVITGPVGITCSNPTVLVGLDAVADAELQTQCAAKLEPFADSPKDAYAVAARGAKRANGSSLGVTRLQTCPLGFGRLAVFAATAAGAVPGTVGDLSSDLGCLDEAIQTQAVPLTVHCDVYSATPKTVNIEAQVWVYNTTGHTEAQLKNAIADELTGYVEALPIGGNGSTPTTPGRVHAEDLKSSIMRARVGENGPSVRAFRTVITSPDGDIVLAPGEVAVLGTMTLTVTRVAPNGGVVAS